MDDIPNLRVELFFDYSSPWTYFAFLRMQRLVAQYRDNEGVDLDVVYKPILVGVIFNEVNHSVYDMRNNPVIPKAIYTHKDMEEWASAFGLQLRLPYGENPPDKFPVNSAKALRGAFYAMEKERFIEYSLAVFHEHWVNGKDIGKVDVLRSIAAGCGLDADELVHYAVNNQRAKDLLRNNNQELIDRGGFGSPTMFLNETTMFFGNDRIPLLERRLDLLLNGEIDSNEGFTKWTWVEKSPSVNDTFKVAETLLEDVQDRKKLRSIGRFFTPDAAIQLHFGPNPAKQLTVAQFVASLEKLGGAVHENVQRIHGDNMLVQQYKTTMKNGSSFDTVVILRIGAEGLVQRVDEYINETGAMARL